MVAPTIKGTTVNIGYAGATYSGTIRDGSSHQPTGDIEYIRNENNEEGTAIISNPGKRITVEFTVGASVPTPTIGAVVMLDGESMMVEAADIRYSRTATRGSITGYKPDALSLGS